MFLTILFDLTLFQRCRNVPLLVEGGGQKGEVCHPQLVMLSKAKHPYWIDLTLSAGADIPLLVKERDKRVRFAILNPVMLSEAKHPQLDDLTLSAGADIPLLAKERDKRVRFAILNLSC
jgi:hypothetical protein